MNPFELGKNFNQTDSQLNGTIYSGFKSHNPFQNIELSSRLINNQEDTSVSDQQWMYTSQDKQIKQSIQRRFNLKLSKQKQYYAILLNKLKQQIQILKYENENLKKLNNELTLKLSQQSMNAQNSNNFQVNSFLAINQTKNLKNMFLSLEKQHELCIQNKKLLLDQLETLQMKINLLQKQNKEVQAQLKECKKKNQEFSQISTQNQRYKSQVQSLKQEIASLKTVEIQKEMQFNKQLSSLQKAIQQIQNRNFQNDQSQIDQFPGSNDATNLEAKMNKSFQKAIEELKFQRTKNSFFLTKIPQNSNVLVQTQNIRSENEKIKKESKQLIQKQIIDGLYRKNLSILREKNDVYNSESERKRTNQEKKIWQATSQTSRQNDLSNKEKENLNIAQIRENQHYNSKTGVSITNRRFRYL